MHQVLYFDSPSTPYVADATVLACFDARFEPVLRKLLKRLHLLRPDVIRVAGGPKALVSGTDDQRDVVFEQFRMSHRLHGSTSALLVAHSDCSAYGGLADRAVGDHYREPCLVWAELTQAASVLDALVGGFRINVCFLDFERAWMPQSAPSPDPGETTLSAAIAMPWKQEIDVISGL